MYAFFFLYDKLRTYGAFAVQNQYVLSEYKNVENVQIRIKFEFENFGSDKTVLWKTYVTYGGNAKERKSTYRKRIFFIRNCALFHKTYLSFRTFFTDKLRTYVTFAVQNRYVLPEYKNVHKTYHFRIRFFIGHYSDLITNPTHHKPLRLIVMGTAGTGKS